jgi:asparagine synthetase B (glutamine-hydrolysing)
VTDIYLRDLLHGAVGRYVTPGTGVLLSGGIDSSTVAHFAPASGNVLHAVVRK